MVEIIPEKSDSRPEMHALKFINPINKNSFARQIGPMHPPRPTAPVHVTWSRHLERKERARFILPGRVSDRYSRRPPSNATTPLISANGGCRTRNATDLHTQRTLLPHYLQRVSNLITICLSICIIKIKCIFLKNRTLNLN